MLHFGALCTAYNYHQRLSTETLIGIYNAKFEVTSL
jgi:hypothetical protein